MKLAPAVRSRRRRLAAGLTAVALATALLGPLAPAGAVAEPAGSATIGPGAEPAAAVLDRLVGADAAKFDLSLNTGAGGQDSYTVTASGGRVSIEGSTPATILAGFNAYVGQVLHQSVSWNSSSLDVPEHLPEAPPIEQTANVAHRFVNNDVEDGYTGAYRTLEQWKDAIDIFALHGLNEVFMPVGTEAVYLEVLQQYGYSESELLAWIPQAAHQPWWLLQNMSRDPRPLSLHTVTERAALGTDIADYIRSLGMVPVLPGYFGTVPAGFQGKNPGSAVIAQGGWVGGYQRPDWLDPNNALFPQLADAFYATSAALLGESSMYKMDLLHEGGTAGNANVSTATVAVERALQTAHPGAIWVLLGWQHNPPQAVAAAANPATTFIVDGISDRHTGQNREASWRGIPYAFGTIWNFGGHTTMGSQLSVHNTRYFDWLTKPGSTMKGLAIMPEGGENNPVAFDFFAGLAWRSGPVELSAWFADFAHRRYGVADPHAAAAWNVLRQTAYDLPSNDGWSEAADGLFGAAPSLTVNTAAAWSPGRQRYNTDVFATALPQLLAAAPAVKATPSYRYDLMDVSRQVLSNLSRTLLPQLKTAYDAGNVTEYQRLAALWLDTMDLMDDIAGTNEQQLLGRWIAQGSNFTTVVADKAALAADQRSLVSLWSPGLSNLNDYANREWNGLVGGYYKARWSAFFTALEQRLTGSGPGLNPDWGAMGAAFIDGTAPYEPEGGYATTATGDIAALAADALARYNEVHGATLTPPVLPAPPGNGITHLSELPFVSNDFDAALGPVGRNTAIGDTVTRVVPPLTLAGQVYAKGLGVNSPSSLVFHLGGVCTTFSSIAGIDATMDLPGKSPNVIFRVLGDGRALFTSEPFSASRGAAPQAPLNISLDVSGVQLLTLQVDPNGENWFDRANWADARVSCGGAEAAPAAPGAGVTALSHLPFRSDDSDPQFGQVARDTEIGDPATRIRQPLSINRVSYATGLGVQAPTTLEFNVGERCSLFQALVGIDGTMEQPGKSPSVTFTVLGDGQELFTSGEVTGGVPRVVDVPLLGVATLTLRVTAGASSWFDRANWANARVTCVGAEPAPLTTAALPPAPPSGWHTSAPLLTLTAEPAATAHVQFSFAGEPWRAYEAPLPLPEGSTLVSYRSVSATGSTEAARTLGPLRVDTISPTVTAQLSGRTITATASDGGVAEDAAQLARADSEGATGSGVAGLELSLDGAASWQAYEAPLVAGADGLSAVFRATDHAGNVSAPTAPLVVGAVGVPTASAAPSTSAPPLPSPTPSAAPTQTLVPSPTSAPGTAAPSASGLPVPGPTSSAAPTQTLVPSPTSAPGTAAPSASGTAVASPAPSEAAPLAPSASPTVPGSASPGQAPATASLGSVGEQATSGPPTAGTDPALASTGARSAALPLAALVLLLGAVLVATRRRSRHG